MSRIEWSKPGERFFETGVDRGVLYPRTGAGVPWNGLTTITENVSGGDSEALYYDGVKFMDMLGAEDFSATLEAYSSPDAFAACDGTREIAPGLSVTQQPRRTFDLSYRTLIGNDLVGEEFGYKLHIVYNCTASPSARTNETLTNSPSPQKRSWQIDTVPPPASTYKPTAHIVIDSTKIDADFLETLETALYGRDADGTNSALEPYLPTVDEILALRSSVITDFITATI